MEASLHGITVLESALAQIYLPAHEPVERHRYLYSQAELESWMPVIESAATEATRTIVFFNNCYGNYGSTNAREMIAILTG